jgi:hypothetical protein
MTNKNNKKDQTLKASVRLFQCARCLSQVTICTYCDRGNIYCSKACSIPAKKTSRCLASKRYQLTPRGKQNHARCQQRYRARQRDKIKTKNKKVIDHGSLSNSHELSSLTMDETNITSQEKYLRCDFCGQQCSTYVRRDFLNHYRRSRVRLASASMAFAQGP